MADEFEIYIYLSLDKYKGSQYNSAHVFHIYELKCCTENSVNPDLDLHCVQ